MLSSQLSTFYFVSIFSLICVQKIYAHYYIMCIKCIEKYKENKYHPEKKMHDYSAFRNYKFTLWDLKWAVPDHRANNEEAGGEAHLFLHSGLEKTYF